jgi:hypothetical protein
MNKKAEGSSETPVIIYQAAPLHMPEDYSFKYIAAASRQAK